MPRELNKHLAGILNSTEIESVFGSITTAVTYRGTNDAAYEGIVEAYTTTMKVLLIAATAVGASPLVPPLPSCSLLTTNASARTAVVPPCLAVLVSNIKLSNNQNAVEGEDLAGRPTDAKREKEDLA